MVYDARGITRELSVRCYGHRTTRYRCDNQCAHRIQCDAVITRFILSQVLKQTPHSSPVSYGVSVVSSKYDFSYASVTAALCVISWYTAPRYNGTRQYTLYYTVFYAGIGRKMIWIGRYICNIDDLTYYRFLKIVAYCLMAIILMIVFHGHHDGPTLLSKLWRMWNILDYTRTLSQWSFSGNPVAIQCAWNLDPSVHWNATGERNVGSQCVSNVLPVVIQWLTSGLPVCFNHAN